MEKSKKSQTNTIEESHLLNFSITFPWSLWLWLQVSKIVLLVVGDCW